MNQELIHKYSVPVPRYTSYPPANYFDERFTAESYRNAIIESNNQQPEHISFYVHIPFCYQMCYYCGCNSLLLKDKSIIASYIETLKREMELVLPLLNNKRKISQIHFGGGSPTTLAISDLKEINDVLLSGFDTIDNPEIAIECHPGYLDEKYWNDLSEAGFNRISLGIQDFNENVLKAVNRKPSKISVEDIVKILKGKGIAINMDFIYGLPLQTVDSFSETIKRAIDMRPDRLVTFSYAHVPWVNALQTNLEKVGIPSALEKNGMYGAAKNLLSDSGYKVIGLDHFVLSDDELFLAQQNKTLHRNFQGYCTRRTTGQVYAFGATGISQLGTAYSQNAKDLKTYMEQVSHGKLPVFKGYSLNEEERITRQVITNLMCNYEIYWKDIADQLNVSVEQIKSAINYDEKTLNDFAADDIIEFTTDYIKVLPDATPFVRNVAASFDKLLLNSSGKQFSKVG